jgi:2-keto-4-pentenoate hydratase
MTGSLTPAAIERAAGLLASVPPGGPRPDDLPAELRPETWDDAYAVQDAVVRRLGPVAGWKVGATSPEAEPFRSAITTSTLRTSPARLALTEFAFVGVEAELAYLVGHDLPARDRPYDTSEVAAAIASIHAAIEIVDSRFARFGTVDRPTQAADRMNHGALVVGSGATDWAAIDPPSHPVDLHISGYDPVHTIGGNSAGHPLRMMVWMANVGARSLGGLRAGQWVTTGSCTGTIFVDRPCRVTAAFPGIGIAELELA